MDDKVEFVGAVAEMSYSSDDDDDCPSSGRAVICCCSAGLV